MVLGDTQTSPYRPQQVTLYFKQGTSDKVYQVRLIPQQDSFKDPFGNVTWHVHASYGRRGGTMRHIDKLKGGTESYTRALREYNKLVQSKVRKGYVPGAGGLPFSIPMDPQETKKVTGWVPQLVNPVSFEEAAGIYRGNEGNVYLQTKWDGERRGVLCNEEIVGANRKGLQVPLTNTIQSAIQRICQHTSPLLDLDTEDMGDYLMIFDVLKFGRENLRNMPFKDRVLFINTVAAAVNAVDLPFLAVDIPVKPTSYVEFVSYIEDAKERNEEGVIIRVGDTIYRPGKPSIGGGVYKLKFKESATCRVEFVHPTKSSVGLELQDSEGNWVSVGNTTIYPNSEFPAPDDLVEVEYLYAYPGGSLYQPVYKGPRKDVDESAAVLNQLKYKKGT